MMGRICELCLNEDDTVELICNRCIEEGKETLQARADYYPKVVEALHKKLDACCDKCSERDDCNNGIIIEDSTDIECDEHILEYQTLSAAQALLPSVSSGQLDSADTDELCVECGEGCVGCNELGINASDKETTHDTT